MSKYPAKAHDIWNVFDEYGLKLGIPRLKGETNQDYLSRLKSMVQSDNNASLQGMVNAISSILGLESYNLHSVKQFRLRHKPIKKYNEEDVNKYINVTLDGSSIDEKVGSEWDNTTDQCFIIWPEYDETYSTLLEIKNATNDTLHIKYETKQYFKTNKARFFKEFIDTKRLNINYTSYDSDTLTEAIRYLHKNANVGAIFIDYIQLLNLAKGKYKTYSRQEEIKEICIALKDVAVETGLPIILGAQFNRTVVNQLHLHPTKLGEAGDIERIANLIVGFWNNNFKPIATEGELNQINQLGATTPDTIYTEILKNRGGKVGLKEILSFNGNTATIKNQEETPEEDIF